MKLIEDFFEKIILTPLKERIKEEKNLIQFIKLGTICEKELVDRRLNTLWGKYPQEHLYFKIPYGNFYRVCRTYTLKDVYSEIHNDNKYFLDGSRMSYRSMEDFERMARSEPDPPVFNSVDHNKKNFVQQCERVMDISTQTGEKQLLFIENIELIEDWGNLLKGIYDECRYKSINVMFIVSWPKAFGEESLAGRFEVIGGTNV